jgi:putative two-component system response regulator
MRLLHTVIELVERRNEVSGGHVGRTRQYVEVLLDVLIKNNIYSDIVTSWEKELVLNSTMLYDLGKLSIHDAILLKPDKLEEEEYSTMKNHTLMGVKIIDHIRADLLSGGTLAENSREANILDYAKEFAGYHHEKWDGSGYPNGLKGYNIPLPGRLMAIADVYDALISKKTYKNSYTHEEAKAIISQGKGTHFDPVLVDVFISEADKFRNIAGQTTRAT